MRGATVLKLAAFIPVLLAAGVLLYLARQERAIGSWNALANLIPALSMVLLLALGWRWPLAIGLLFVVGGAIQSMRLFVPSRESELIPWPIVLTGGPLMMSGVLLIGAAWLRRQEVRRSARLLSALRQRQSH